MVGWRGEGGSEGGEGGSEGGGKRKRETVSDKGMAGLSEEHRGRKKWEGRLYE